MFYFFFESRSNKDDPVVIWLTGGPGCSSELAMFYENGPFAIADNMSLVWNEYGWDKVLRSIYSFPFINCCYLGRILNVLRYFSLILLYPWQLIWSQQCLLRLRTCSMLINQLGLASVIPLTSVTSDTMKMVSVTTYMISCRSVNSFDFYSAGIVGIVDSLDARFFWKRCQSSKDL